MKPSDTPNYTGKPVRIGVRELKDGKQWVVTIQRDRGRSTWSWHTTKAAAMLEADFLRWAP
jgi:hypothetical protein